MVSEDVLERWLKLELGKVHDGLVRGQVPLATLLRMDEPVAQTRGGQPHLFDPEALQALAEGISEATRDRLKLPITVYLDKDAPGNAYVGDGAAIAALVELGEARTEPRDGKLWMGTALARDLSKRYPTLVQFVML